MPFASISKVGEKFSFEIPIIHRDNLSPKHGKKRTGKSRSEFEGENMKNMSTYYLAELLGSAIKHLKWINLF
tara:strand:- start:35 stop:250 length:216 start_codon:yes stop_codon:yes gene_type:complete